MQFIEEKELPEFSIEVECERCKSKLLLNIEDISVNVSKDYSYAEHINDYSYMYNYYYICPKCNKINIVYDIS